jgi:23S rRNA (cytidine1920-2'-O)/16S rRNA (cytidine1409-2'-O)-methyltransferase
LATESDSETSPRKRADVLLVERGLFEKPRPRPRGDRRRRRDRQRRQVSASEMIADGCRIVRAAAHPTFRAAASSWPARWSVSDRYRGPCLPRRRRIHRRLLRRCCWRTAPGLVFAIDVGHGQLHPSLRNHPRIVSMEETDIRKFEGKRRLPGPMSSSSTSVSFR